MTPSELEERLVDSTRGDVSKETFDEAHLRLEHQLENIRNIKKRILMLIEFCAAVITFPIIALWYSTYIADGNNLGASNIATSTDASISHFGIDLTWNLYALFGFVGLVISSLFLTILFTYDVPRAIPISAEQLRINSDNDFSNIEYLRYLANDYATAFEGNQEIVRVLKRHLKNTSFLLVLSIILILLGMFWRVFPNANTSSNWIGYVGLLVLVTFIIELCLYLRFWITGKHFSVFEPALNKLNNLVGPETIFEEEQKIQGGNQLTRWIESANAEETITIASGEEHRFGAVTIDKPVIIKGEDGQSRPQITGRFRIESDQVQIKDLKITNRGEVDDEATVEIHRSNVELENVLIRTGETEVPPTEIEILDGAEDTRIFDCEILREEPHEKPSIESSPDTRNICLFDNRLQNGTVHLEMAGRSQIEILKNTLSNPVNEPAVMIKVTQETDIFPPFYELTFAGNTVPMDESKDYLESGAIEIINPPALINDKWTNETPDTEIKADLFEKNDVELLFLWGEEFPRTE